MNKISLVLSDNKSLKNKLIIKEVSKCRVPKKVFSSDK